MDNLVSYERNLKDLLSKAIEGNFFHDAGIEQGSDVSACLGGRRDLFGRVEEGCDAGGCKQPIQLLAGHEVEQSGGRGGMRRACP